MASPFLPQQALFWPNLNILYQVASVGAQVSHPNRRWHALEQALQAGLLPSAPAASAPSTSSSTATSVTATAEPGAREVSQATLHLLQAAGVRIVATYFGLHHPQLLPLGDIPIPGLDTPVRLYGIEDPLPRAWLARSLRACTWETTVKRLEERRIGPGWAPCKVGDQDDSAPDASAALASFLEPIARGEQVFELKVSTRKEVWVIQRELWAPGWIALVDGIPQEALAADGIYRAAQVPAGEHIVRFEYRPRGMNDGLLLNMLGIALLGLLTLIKGRPLQAMDDALTGTAGHETISSAAPKLPHESEKFLSKSESEWYN